MQVYEAKIQYSLVRAGSDEPLNTPAKIVDYMAGAFDDTPTQESFYVVCLNRKNRPLCRSRISLGTACNTLVHPREVFRIAVLASATAIVCVHNHPSGDPSPSAADLAVTRLWEASHKRVYVKRRIMGTRPRQRLARRA